MDVVNPSQNKLGYKERIKRPEILYHFYQKHYEDSQQRLRAIEDKGVKVFGLLSVMLTAFVVIVRFAAGTLLNTPTCVMHILIIIAGCLTFISVCGAWSFIFRALIIHPDPAMPVGREFESFILNSDTDSSYWGLSKRYTEAVNDIDVMQAKKSRLINLSFRVIKYSAGSFIIFVILILAISLHERENSMFIKIFKKPKVQVSENKIDDAQTSNNYDYDIELDPSNWAGLPKRIDLPPLRRTNVDPPKLFKFKW